MKSYAVSPTMEEHYWTGRLSLLGLGASATPEITTVILRPVTALRAESDEIATIQGRFNDLQVPTRSMTRRGQSQCRQYQCTRTQHRHNI